MGTEKPVCDPPKINRLKSVDASAAAKQMLWRVQLVNWRVLLVTNL
jgi:hypothetical protein